MRRITETINKLSYKTVIILVIISIILIALDIKMVFNVKKTKEKIERVNKYIPIEIIKRDSIFHLPPGTIVKVYSMSPLVIEVTKTGSVLEENGNYYYYTKGINMYILSSHNKKYIELIKE